MLSIKNISKNFGGVQAVKDVSFNVLEGKTTALIGPNGAGKTTMFHIISGLLAPDSGEIYYNNQDITAHSASKRAKKIMSQTFQQVRLFPNLTIADHLDMASDHEDMDIIKNILSKKNLSTPEYSEYINNYGIFRSVDTLAGDLSYGQKKLLEIAIALKKSHELLLLDEPVAGVNAKVQEKIERLIEVLKQKNETILLIDHDMSFIRRLADIVVVMDAGELLVSGKPDEVLEDKRVLEAYLGR